ncbi:histone-like nucleoid-structuring protein [Xanthomonas oryzae pv. oryzicola]|nr:histone-like nucleoid-structuring protein [Xanthomonas oryzae pv. oryzicola]
MAGPFGLWPERQLRIHRTGNPANVDVAKPKKVASTRKEVVPKYWLPHNQETWSWRGRPPKAFTIWQGSASYKEWQAKHPDEKFPKYPG